MMVCVFLCVRACAGARACAVATLYVYQLDHLMWAAVLLQHELQRELKAATQA